MRLLYINNLFGKHEGGSVHCRSLLQEIMLLGVDVITLPDYHECKIIKNKESFFKRNILFALFSKFTEIALFFKKVLASGISFIKIYRTIVKHKPDCLLIRPDLYDITPLMLKRYFDIPVILEINAPLFLERVLAHQLEGKKVFLPKFLKHFEIFTWKSSDAIYVVSNNLKRIVEEELQDGVKIIKTIPNGATSNDFINSGSRYYNNDSPIVNIGFVGNFNPWHGIDLLLDAVSCVAEKKPYIKLHVVGDGPIRAVLEKNILNNKYLVEKVEFTGKLSREGVISKLAQMDILVAPFLPMQNFYFSPLKIFEYMAAGKAIIASRIGQISEVLTDGVDAILVTPGDKDELSRAIISLVDSPEKRSMLGKNALEKAKDYTWERSARELLELINTVVTNK